MLLDEETLTLTQATKLLPTRPHVSTLWRWCRQGLRGVQLEYRRCGDRIVTSKEALERFGLALADLDAEDAAQARKSPHRLSRSEAARRAAIEKAERATAEAGI